MTAPIPGTDLRLRTRDVDVPGWVGVYVYRPSPNVAVGREAIIPAADAWRLASPAERVALATWLGAVRPVRASSKEETCVAAK